MRYRLSLSKLSLSREIDQITSWTYSVKLTVKDQVIVCLMAVRSCNARCASVMSRDMIVERISKNGHEDARKIHPMPASFTEIMLRKLTLEILTSVSTTDDQRKCDISLKEGLCVDGDVGNCVRKICKWKGL